MTENNTNTENIPQPALSSDYYPVWHSLEYVKGKIISAQRYMSAYSNGNYQSSQQIKDFLVPASEKLIQIIDNDLDYEEEEEESE
ncbi:hypothetical protein JYQ62_08420 [Nostoc sp. UHCC 0702]|nr:hypothetical protein JYQ62_08420 [Nostoc sp. UHCC 0702]